MLMTIVLILIALVSVAQLVAIAGPLIGLLRSRGAEPADPEPAEVTRPGRDTAAELLGAVIESAAYRWPHVHPEEAVERFTVDLRGLNLYYRDEARKKAAAAAPAEAITSFDVVTVEGG